MTLQDKLSFLQGSIRNRAGRFSISRPMFEEHIDDLPQLFAGMVVVETRTSFYNDSIEYIACGRMFDEGKEGEEVPWYDILINRDAIGGVVIELQRRV